MTDKKQDQAHLRYVVDVVLDANGEDHDELRQRMASAFGRAIGNGALSGDSAAEVDSYEAATTLLSPQAASLDEDELAAWISEQLESGAMPLERVAKLMARYALGEPVDLREEFVERMRLGEPGGDEQPPASATATLLALTPSDLGSLGEVPAPEDSRLELDLWERSLWKEFGETRRISMTKAEMALVLKTADPALERLRAQIEQGMVCTVEDRDIYILAVRAAREADVEVDNDAMISQGDDNGAQVSCYRWVPFDGTPYDKDADPEEAADFVVTDVALNAAFRSCMRSSSLDGVGGESIFNQIRNPSQMSREVFLCLQDFVEHLELMAASGREMFGGCSLEELQPLMEAQPWTLHPDRGCVLKADVDALDKSPSEARRERG